MAWPQIRKNRPKLATYSSIRVERAYELFYHLPYEKKGWGKSYGSTKLPTLRRCRHHQYTRFSPGEPHLIIPSLSKWFWTEPKKKKCKYWKDEKIRLFIFLDVFIFDYPYCFVELLFDCLSKLYYKYYFFVTAMFKWP